MRGVFVTGTDTEVGKTVVACAIAATLAAQGQRVATFKPAVTGLTELHDVLPDHELLRRSAGSPQAVVARPGLGTISHTLMTIECARAAGLDVAAVVLTPWRRFPRAIERSNRRTIEKLGEVETFGLPKLEIADGVGPVRAIPVERWVGHAVVNAPGDRYVPAV